LASAAASTKSQEDAEALRWSLLDAISRDHVPDVHEQCKRVDALHLTLTDPKLRDPTDRATVLHTALVQGRWKVADYLIRSTTDDQRLLDEVYDVTGLR